MTVKAALYNALMQAFFAGWERGGSDMPTVQEAEELMLGCVDIFYKTLPDTEDAKPSKHNQEEEG